ncbi:MAG: Ku protein [Polyangiales bacterium]
MAARAMWKGILHFGTHKLPVKLYAALSEQGVHFRLLDKRGKPVSQQLIDPSSGEPVAYDEVRRGFAVRDGFIALDKDELDALEPQASREISVSGFVTTRKLGPEWLLRPYYLGPDGNEEAYFALAVALAAEKKQGVARWVMRGKEYAGVLGARDGYLMLTTLRHADEVIAQKQLPAPKGRAHAERELKMAEQLIEAYEDAFDPADYKDAYRERVLAFVEQKAKGKKPRLKKPVVKKSEGALSDALSRSLAAAHKKKERNVA